MDTHVDKAPRLHRGTRDAGTPAVASSPFQEAGAPLHLPTLVLLGNGSAASRAACLLTLSSRFHLEGHL